MPVAATKEAAADPRPVDVVLAGRDDHRRHRLGPDRLRLDPLPPPQRDRDPGADALQPADRDLLHDRPDHDGDRLLLLHPGRPGQGAAHRHRTAHDVDPDETVTVVGQQWSWTFNYNLGYDKEAKEYEPADGEEVVHEGGTTADRPDAVAGQGQERRVQPLLARRHPLVLGARLPVQDGRRPRVRAQQLRAHPDPRGHLRGPLRRAVRRLPLADALQRQGRRASPSTTPTSPSSPSRATPARPWAAPRSPRRRASSPTRATGGDQ